METVISSKTKTVIISPDRPFTIIGERINPTGRKKLAAEMAAGDFSRVVADAVAQVEAGAHMLDVNAGIPMADEPAILAEAIRLVQSVVDVPLSIDSSIVAALERGLEAYEGKALVNSVTGEEERLEAVLPLVKKYGVAVIAISNDDGHLRRPAGAPSRSPRRSSSAQDYGIRPRTLTTAGDPPVRCAARKQVFGSGWCARSAGVNTPRREQRFVRPAGA